VESAVRIVPHTLDKVLTFIHLLIVGVAQKKAAANGMEGKEAFQFVLVQAI
jgi:hypothetical protein